MQHQHSCGTLENRIQIFCIMVEELQSTFYPLDHDPLIPRAGVHIKSVALSGNLSGDQGSSNASLKIGIPRSELEI